jgi:hypothetical protein
MRGLPVIPTADCRHGVYDGMRGTLTVMRARVKTRKAERTQ